MKLDELLSALQELPRSEKYRAVQFLTGELAQEESAFLMSGEFPVWSPHDAVGTAHTLTEYLRKNSEPR